MKLCPEGRALALSEKGDYDRPPEQRQAARIALGTHVESCVTCVDALGLPRRFFTRLADDVQG